MNLIWLYVAALYAAAVILMRRAGVDLPKRIALFFYALVLVFFFKPMTQRYVNIPVDVLTIVPPWTQDIGRGFLNAEMNDVTFQHAPWAHQVREGLRAGRFPLWNEAAGSGYPLLANGQSSAFSPIRILALPIRSLGRAMTAEAAMKMLVALTFTFLFCRGRGRSELASAMAAVAFAFGGFMAVWLHFPHVTTACFLPAVLYLIDRLAEKVTFGAFTMAAIVWASIVYGGHPETASHIFVLALLYLLWMVAVQRTATWRLFLTLGGAMCVAALLSAPFLLTFAEAVPRSMRFAALQAEPWRAETLPYKDIQSAFTQLQPHFWGRVPMSGKWGPSDPDPLSGFAGTLGVISWIVLLTGVLRQRAWRSLEAFFVLATLFVFGVMMAWPLLGEGVHIIMPLVAHHRFRLLLTMLLALQTAWAADRLIRGEERTPFLVSAGVVAMAITWGFFHFEFPEQKWLITALHAAIPTAAVLITTVIAAMVRRPAFVLALFVFLIAEIWSVTYPWSPPLREEWMYPHTPILRAMQELAAREPEPFRIAGWSATFFPNMPAMFGLEDIRVHDPMADAKYAGLLHHAAGYKTADYFAKWENLDTPLLDYLNVRYVLVDDATLRIDEGRYETLYSGHDGRILRNRSTLPRFFPVRNVILEFRNEFFISKLRSHQDWAQTALLNKLTLETPQMGDDFFKPRRPDSPLATSQIVRAANADYRLRTQAPRWSLVASSIPWWPGWKVERNGRRVDPIRVNGVFLGFAVPPGTSEVRVWYAPWTFWGGLWAAVGTMAVLAAVALKRRI